MRTLILFSFLISQISWAGPCEAIFSNVNVDRTHGNIYFNRWTLPDGAKAEEVMGSAIQTVAVEEHLPMLIFDTNPDAKVWSEFNIVRPEDDDLFPGLTYRQLTEDQKQRLFMRFAVRTLVHLRNDMIPVLVFDHHFHSKILSDASSTSLVVDFLYWLNERPETRSREKLRQVIELGIRLRDHSDPDILLANAAANWVRFPTMLRMHGEQIKRIAYFNDHGILDPKLSDADRREVLLGYYLTIGFEEMITAEKGGFERALDFLDFGLERVFHVAHEEKIDSEDGVPELLKELKRFAIFDSTVKVMEQQKAARDLFQHQMQDIYSRKGAMERLGATAVVRFPPALELPSSLEVMQYLKAHPLRIFEDAKYLAVVCRETHADGEHWHVKLRVLNGKGSLDPLIQAIRETGMGGGGRSSAGALYAAAGKKAGDPNELELDLTWALSFLR